VLAITPDAAKAIKKLTAGPVVDAVRIFTASAAQNGTGPSLRVAVVPAPDADDVVAEVDGALIYVDPAALEVLDDTVLDADLDGEEVRFALHMGEKD
jgi:iron-sulfur cluster assembly protein